MKPHLLTTVEKNLLRDLCAGNKSLTNLAHAHGEQTVNELARRRYIANFGESVSPTHRAEDWIAGQVNTTDMSEAGWRWSAPEDGCESHDGCLSHPDLPFEIRFEAWCGAGDTKWVAR